MAGYKQIVAANRRSGGFQLCADFGVDSVRRGFEGSDFKYRKNGFELPGKPDGVFLESPISQFRCDNDAGKDFVFTYCSDAGCAFALWISNQIRDGVGVREGNASQISNGRGGLSFMAGNFSVSGFRRARTPSNERFGAGSITRRFPSFRITASSAWNSNSRGMRTA